VLKKRLNKTLNAEKKFAEYQKQEKVKANRLTDFRFAFRGLCAEVVPRRFEVVPRCAMSLNEAVAT
jgi:hypothetical protein